MRITNVYEQFKQGDSNNLISWIKIKMANGYIMFGSCIFFSLRKI